MLLTTKRCVSLILRLIVGLALLGWPRIGNAAGTWSVISLPQQPGEVSAPRALAVDAAGNLYVGDSPAPDYIGRIQKRDAQGNWSVIATQGSASGQVNGLSALAVDTTGNLYEAEAFGLGDRIQNRDAQGNWSILATAGDALGQVDGPTALAADAMGNLYVGDYSNGGRIQKRETQGNWSVLANYGAGLGQVDRPNALAVDTVGNLYVADSYNNRVLKYTPSP